MKEQIGVRAQSASTAAVLSAPHRHFNFELVPRPVGRWGEGEIRTTNCRIHGGEECEDNEPGIFNTTFQLHMLTKNE
jgi:hypothetical protein